jgi:hypothetical protein
MTNETSIEITGPVHRIAFPDLCCCCGCTPAHERILIERAFEHWQNYSDPSSSWWEFTSIRVPFCSSCAAEHRQQEKRIDPVSRVLLLFQNWMAIPMLGSAFFAIFLSFQTMAHPEGWLFSGGAAVFFALIGLGSVIAGWRNTRHRALPEQTAIASSFIFSEDQKKLLEPHHRIITLRNPAFAAAFVEANRSRIWNPDGPYARTARNWRWAVWTLLCLAGLLAAIWEQLRHH